MLSSHNQPSDVQKWIKGHRKAAEMPDVSLDVNDFAQKWRTWWDSLNPERDPASETSPDISEYAELRKAGRNGLFLLILTLVWWGAAAADQGEERMNTWRTAVSDFTATVKFFNRDMREAPERKRPRDNTESESSRKKYVPC